MKPAKQKFDFLELKEHSKEMKNVSMRGLFDENPRRFDEFSTEACNIFLDYSKNIITKNTIQLLLDIAEKVNLREETEKMFSGEKINITEKRAVLHTALRNRGGSPVYFEGKDVMPAVNAELEKMRKFVESVHTGGHKGHTGQKITDVVNIGIGGSGLGPAMACKALKPYANEIKAHFVSNVDGAHIYETLKTLRPETTLFIVASKSFTTQETLMNANTAKKWLIAGMGGAREAVKSHFIALSTNKEAVEEFGIDLKNIFEFWDWVGGRYSLWSVIGMPIALYIGWGGFIQFLEGAHEMDKHFRQAPYSENIPVIMALLGVWYSNFFNAKTYAVIPYSQYLERFPAFLQQLDMESNGKGVTRNGDNTDYSTGPVIWGEPGTDAQHSFFQLIHQGSQLIPADFLAAANPATDEGGHQEALLSNFFAQTEALMKGKTEQEARAELEAKGLPESEIINLLPHKVFPGNKPTNTILFPRLAPKILGSLIAMYEHKVFTQGIIWDINSFDQWGVELGKQLAKAILPELEGPGKVSSHDSSTNGLINYYKSLRG